MREELSTVKGQMVGLQQELEAARQHNLQLQCEVDDLEAEKQSVAQAPVDAEAIGGRTAEVYLLRSPLCCI